MVVEFIEAMANGILWIVDYGILIILGLLGWEIFRFVTTMRKEMKSEREEEKEEKEEEGEDEEAKEKAREKRLGPIKGFIINAEEAAEKLEQLASANKTTADKKGKIKTIKGVKSLVGKIKSNFKKADGELKKARRKEKGEIREFFGKMRTYTQVGEKLDKEIEIPEEKGVPGTWISRLDCTEKKAKEIRGDCGVILTAIDKFIEEEKIEIMGKITQEVSR